MVCVTNLVGDLRSAHHQMSPSLYHYTQTVAPHPGLHLPVSITLIASTHVTNQQLYKSPGLSPCKPRSIPPAFSDSRSCLLDYPLRLACDIPVCSCFDPACTTMSLSRPNKSLQVDPLASRLVYPVTEYSVTPGSSSFTPGHSTDMDTDRILFRIKQGPRTLEQHIREFLAIANYSTLPDCTIIEIYCDGVNEPLRARLRREGPRSSLAEFLNFALLCVGSPCTVEERDNADMAAAHPPRRLAVTPGHDATNKFLAWITREMAAVSERAALMAATAVPVHKMAAAPERVHTLAATTEPVHKVAATAVPVHKMAAVPARAHKMAATAEPVHKMAARTELRHVTAAIPEPYKAAAVFPESSQ
ncbi:hypothetical protein M9458_025998, partial [Cirrhinus mrigala]